MKKDLIVKDNTLINASYTLSLTEQRLLLLSISKAQESGLEINHNDYITIHAEEFVKAFGVNDKSVYASLKEACTTLFRREFSYRTGKTVVHSRWLQSSKYNDDSGNIEILFAKEIVPFISQLKKRFTSYFLKDVSQMTSVYAIRLYELIIAWKSTGKTPVIELEDLRMKLGVEPHEYKRMTNFKARVLDVAIKQINELSNIKIKVTQHKKGRKIIGFSFVFYETDVLDELSKELQERDPNTIDWVNGHADNKKKKRKKITKAEAEKMARVGETWKELLARLTKDFVIVDL